VSTGLAIPLDNLQPLNTTQTGRGDKGRRAILNRKTIHNYGGIWFDALPPAYYDCEYLQHKVLLRSLLVEQSNYLIAIPVLSRYALSIDQAFEALITISDDIPSYNSANIYFDTEPLQVVLIKKDEFREVVLESMPVPKSYQYSFRLDNSRLLFSGGFSIDLDQFSPVDDNEIRVLSSISPNITVSESLEREIKQGVTTKIRHHSIAARVGRIGRSGQESETVSRFNLIAHAGKLKLQDYSRGANSVIIPGQLKTCLVVRTGTEYPDLLCIFLEDAVRVKPRGGLSLSEYVEYICANIDRFRKLMFGVEVEYNLSSFKSHDTSMQSALPRK
jgi:hypothetical protein